MPIPQIQALYRVSQSLLKWVPTLEQATYVQSLRSTVSSNMHIWGKKLTSPKVTTRHLCVDGWSLCTADHELLTPCSLWHGAVQNVVCRQDSTLKQLVFHCMLLFASRELSCCEHDMGALSQTCVFGGSFTLGARGKLPLLPPSVSGTGFVFLFRTLFEPYKKPHSWYSCSAVALNIESFRSTPYFIYCK